MLNTETFARTAYALKTPSVITIKERCPRIIVEVSKTEHKTVEEVTGNSAKNADRSHIGGPIHKSWEKKVEIVNSSTLAFEMKNQLTNDCYRRFFNFDCVANGETDQLIRWQMSALVDELLVNGRKNCCLVRIGAQRNDPTLQILNHVIIPEISKRLTSTEMSPLLLYAIRVEYYDVRKYDVVNMVLRSAPKSKPRHHITLRNTWELLQWVQETYPILWSQGAGHECLDLKFIFVRDQSGTKLRIKLSLLHFFLNKMDADMAAGLRNFLENSGSANNSRVKHSILTDYLREYYFSPDNWCIWIMFKVPCTSKSEVVSEMITLAASAYAGVQTLVEGGRIKTDISIFKEKDLEKDFLCPIANSSLNCAISRYSTSVRSSSVHLAAQMGFKFPKREKQSLSYWYRQLDEKFLLVLLTMETYYVRKQNSHKMEQQNDNKHPSGRARERRDFITTVRNAPKSILKPDDVGLRVIYASYKQAVVSLHNLIQQMERSPYARLLKVLIQMKNHELVQHLTSLRETTLNAPPKVKRTIKVESNSFLKGKPRGK